MFPLLFVAATAHAGSLDGEVALDVLSASSTADESHTGPDASMSSTELGMRIRADLREVDDRLRVRIDYAGREPIAGNVDDSEMRLLYRADAAFDVVPDRLTLAVGRFVAPAVLFLPVDGLRAEIRPSSKATITAWGGRRGITTSRRNLGLSEVLPAVGAAFGWRESKLLVDAQVAWSKDLAELTPGSVTTKEEYGAASAHAFATWRPKPTWTFGGGASLAQEASYTLGPTWTTVELDVHALNLWSVNGWAAWDPRDDVQLDLDAHHQAIGVWREGTVAADGTVTPESIVDPAFTDIRLRGAYSPPGPGGRLGWLRVDERLRKRSDRTELRTGGGVDADHIGLDGLRVGGMLWVDQVFGTDSPAYSAGIDRLYWTAEVGYRGHGFDAAIGTSSLERALGPVSGRFSDAANSGKPTQSDDLQPFVLEAQDLAYLRGFYSGKRWFAGLDVERNLHDPEMRFFVQVGGLAEVGW